MEFIDHLSRSVFISKPPERIISLVPSQTELLVDLGLEDRIVGVTKFCLHPTYLGKSKTIVGGTKNCRFDIIESLKPDLIIGNKEENDRDGIEKLALSYPVWMSDILDLKDALRMISDLGKIAAKETEAAVIVTRIQRELSEKVPYKGTCVYLIWDNPKMAAGKKTFIDSMLSVAGFDNVVKEERYPAFSEKELIQLSPEYVLLSSEPFPFGDKHRKALQTLLPEAKMLLVDGEMFSWYGSRLLRSMEYFKGL